MSTAVINPGKCLVAGCDQAPYRRGVCLHHWMRHISPPSKNKYFWTPELDALLRRLAGEAETRAQYSAAITAIVKRTGFHRDSVLNRAKRLGVARVEVRRWTAQEVEYLRAKAGRRPLRTIARALRRGAHSVQCKSAELGIACRDARDGYSAHDLLSLFGVAHKTVMRWEARGWLRRRMGRFPDDVLIGFMRSHPEEWSFRRVNETWAKGLLFSTADCYTSARKAAEGVGPARLEGVM